MAYIMAKHDGYILACHDKNPAEFDPRRWFITPPDSWDDRVPWLDLHVDIRGIVFSDNGTSGRADDINVRLPELQRGLDIAAAFHKVLNPIADAHAERLLFNGKDERR